MKFGLKIAIAMVVLIFCTALSIEGEAFDLANPIFYSGITKGGQSGLLLTQGGTTISEGKFYAGFSPGYSNHNISPSIDEKKISIPATFTYGLPYDLELSGFLSFVSIDNLSSESGLSEVGLSIKWSFFKQEQQDLPSLATGVAASIATSSSDKGLSEFQDSSFKWFVSGTALIDMGPTRDYAFALFGEGDLVLNDLGKDNRDTYGNYKGGILLPIPGYTHMAFMAELDGTVNRGIDKKDDFFRITPSYRIKIDRYTVTAAIGYVNPEPDAEDSFIEYTLSGTIGF